MFLMSPAKLLVVLVVALVVLGPDKLPKVAKQVGSLWADLRRFREKLESEVRDTFPDLPSTETITRAVRSPLSFLETSTGDEANRDAPAPAAGDAAPPSGSEMVAGPETDAASGASALLPPPEVASAEARPAVDTALGSDGAVRSETVGVVHQVRLDQNRTADTFELN